MVLITECHNSHKQNQSSVINYGIIGYIRTKTFAKEPKLAKLLRELKSTLMQYHENGISCMSVSLNLPCFSALLRDNL